MDADQIINSKEFRKVIDFHGHLCPGIAIGWRAAAAAMDRLAEARARDEELVAIVETDACGTDAVQVLTGCTFGKGNFVFRDYGKQVFTFFSRGSGKALRFAMKTGALERDKTEQAVFDKVHAGNASEEELNSFKNSRAAKTKKILEMPLEDLFDVREIAEPAPPAAVVMSSLPCARCGEPTMPSKMESAGSEKICRACAAM